MATNTSIEWTDSTWNPIIGCSRVSEGCRNCYAERHAGRFPNSGAYSGLTRIVNGHPQWTGKISETKQLLDPLRWRKPRRIFVNSMSDLFHENVTDEMRDRIFAVMALCPQHTFQVLTKRPERMLAYMDLRTDNREHAIGAYACQLSSGEHNGFVNLPLPNVWLGVSVENQAAADERIPLLLQTPAAKRFISAEPLLGAVDLDEKHDWLTAGFAKWPELAEHPVIDWVICGGESGPGARPMHPDWARSLRDQCQAAGVPFFFKQWGAWVNFGPQDNAAGISTRGKQRRQEDWPNDGDQKPMWRAHVGKKAAGALLDGREWREFPEVNG